MSTKKKLLQKIMSGTQDGNVTFAEALQLLKILGYSIREGKGSHTIASYAKARAILNLQPMKGKAKPYQVRQIRDQIIKLGLGETE